VTRSVWRAASANRSSSGNSDNNKRNVHLLLVILVVVLIVLAIMGFMLGVFLASIAIQRIAQRHVHLLQKQRLAETFVVMDLDGYADLESMQPLQPPVVPSSSSMYIEELREEDKTNPKVLGLME